VSADDVVGPPREPSFDTVNGAPHFRGVRVEHRQVRLGDRTITIAALRDATDLLDRPEFAKRFVEEDRAPYGMELWPAARMLAEHVLRHDPGRGRAAVELGAGLGLVSIAATLAGWRVTASDCDESSRSFAAYNARINGVALDQLLHLDWHGDCAIERRFDRVFAADVLYQAVDHGPILDCSERLLNAGGVAVIVDPNRRIADPFPELAARRGWNVETQPVEACAEDGHRIAGRMFRLRRGDPD
jgi:predicted nicotinamide N-methyase